MSWLARGFAIGAGLLAFSVFVCVVLFGIALYLLSLGLS